MAKLYDINVNITDATQVMGKEGFGKVLLVATSKDLEYKEYDISSNLSEFQTDFPSETEVYKMVNVYAQQQPRPTKISIIGIDVETGKSITETLNELINTNNEWYRVMLESKELKDIKEVSEWCEANDKMFYTQLNTTEIGTEFETRKRTVLDYKENEDNLAAGHLGYVVTEIPGSFTNKFTPIKGITADRLSDAKIIEIKNKNMNPFIRSFASVGINEGVLANGVTANGEYIDHVESMDWIKYRIQYEIARLFVDSKKVPYTDDGIQSIAIAVTNALEDAVSKNIILRQSNGNPAFKVEFLSLDEIPVEMRKKRKLVGITFEYVEAGAIESVDIEGKIVNSITGNVEIEL